jgi:hypothetical protein
MANKTLTNAMKTKRSVFFVSSCRKNDNNGTASFKSGPENNASVCRWLHQIFCCDVDASFNMAGRQGIK